MKTITKLRNLRPYIGQRVRVTALMADGRPGRRVEKTFFGTLQTVNTTGYLPAWRRSITISRTPIKWEHVIKVEVDA